MQNPPKQFIFSKPVQTLMHFVKRITEFFFEKNRSAFSLASKRLKFCNFEIKVLRHPRASLPHCTQVEPPNPPYHRARILATVRLELTIPIILITFEFQYD